jgi:uncharacterized metal-binding protein YceD (DUF177 family)
LAVALEAIPPEGLDLPLNIEPQAMSALAAGDGDEEPPAIATALTGLLRLRLQDARLTVRGSFRVWVTLACDRCLTPASTILAGEIDECLSLAAGDEDGTTEDEALAVTEGRVDLAGLLAESFWLAWPYRFICRPDCAGLCLACGADLNQGACGCAKPD